MCVHVHHKLDMMFIKNVLGFSGEREPIVDIHDIHGSSNEKERTSIRYKELPHGITQAD